MKLIGLLCSVLLLALPCHAQSLNVPLIADHEIARRGHMVEMTGVVGSDLVAAALAPPADDSDKWYVTLIVRNNDEDSQIMRQTIANDPRVRPWIDSANPTASHTHYQVKSIDDVTQKEWVKFLRPAIAQRGLPLIVMQPPRNGKYGNPSNPVKLIHGVCSGEYLSKKLQESRIDYVRKLQQPEISAIAAQPREPIGVAPPFTVQPREIDQPQIVQPRQAPFEYPPSKPTELTFQQVYEACPGASLAFIAGVLESKESSLETVKLKWLVYKLESRQVNPECVVPSQLPPEPQEPESEEVPKPFFHESHQAKYLAMAIIAALLVGWYARTAQKWATETRDKLAAYDALTTANETKIATASTTTTQAPPAPKPISVAVIAPGIATP